MNELVERFVADVTTLARRTALESLEMALSMQGGRSSRAPRMSSGGGRRSKGDKRSGNELQKLQDRLREYIAANPGQRTEEINRALGTSTRDIALPIRKMVAEGYLKAQGARRATRYTIGKKRD